MKDASKNRLYLDKDEHTCKNQFTIYICNGKVWILDAIHRIFNYAFIGMNCLSKYKVVLLLVMNDIRKT